MRTDGTEFFYMVPGLLPPRDEVNNRLVEDIEYFVSLIQKNADDLNFLFKNHIDSFVSMMEVLQDMSNSIYAMWLSNDATKIMKASKASSRSTEWRKLLTQFVVDAHTLAINIQMAQRNNGISSSTEYRNEIERYKDVISSMKVILILLKESNISKAMDIVENTLELQESEYAETFKESMESNNIGQITSQVDDVLNVYTKKIDDINDIISQSSRSKKIVIVDDSPQILTALSYMLKEYYQIFAFPDGVQALNFVDNKLTPDAFLLDIDMPIMDGFTLAGKIRERRQCRFTPLLFFTSHSAREMVVRSSKYDVKDFIVKPSNKDIIISKLSNCFN